MISGDWSFYLDTRWHSPRLLLVLVLALGLSGCGDVCRYLKSGEVGWALKEELRDKKASGVEIAKLTKFEWEELFIFGAYDPTNEICRGLKLSAVECKSTITVETSNDGEALLVFRRKGEVVHVERHFGFHGEFISAPEQPFTPQTAVFLVSVTGKTSAGDDWLVLRRASEASK